MGIWNAEHLPSKDRFPYWREVLCQNYTSLDPITEGEEQFQGRVHSSPLNDLNVTTIASGRQKIYRRRNHIRTDSDSVCFLNLQVRGRCRMVQFGREAVLQPGDFALVDSTEPYLVDYCSGDWEQHSFRIPTALLGSVVSHLDRRMGIRLGGEGSLNGIVTSFLRTLAKQADSLSGSEAALAEQTINLIGLTLMSASQVSDLPQSESGLRECLAEAILRYIAANAQDPELSPAKAAAHFRISVRYVHKALQGSGTTFGKSLMDCRLKICAESLLRERNASVGKIAYRCGFSDLSHFSRAFRAKHDASPTEYRSERTM